MSDEGPLPLVARLIRAARPRRHGRRRARREAPFDGPPGGAVFAASFVDLTHPTGASLAYADLAGADLSQANLPYTNLSAADLTLADLTGANLTGAILADANLTRANLRGVTLAGADLTETDLRLSLYATSAVLLGAEYSERTRWPSELDAGIRARSETVSFGRWRVAK